MYHDGEWCADRGAAAIESKHAACTCVKIRGRVTVEGGTRGR
jgi:hypothetical protein